MRKVTDAVKDEPADRSASSPGALNLIAWCPRAAWFEGRATAGNVSQMCVVHLPKPLASRFGQEGSRRLRFSLR